MTKMMLKMLEMPKPSSNKSMYKLKYRLKYTQHQNRLLLEMGKMSVFSSAYDILSRPVTFKIRS